MSDPEIALPVDGIPIPVTLRVFVQRRKHDWKDNVHIIADQVAKVLIVPEIESSLCDLKVGACHRFRQLMEQRLLDLGELRWVHDLENVFHLIEEHDLFGAVDLGPVPEETKHDLITREKVDDKRRDMIHTSSVRDASFSRNCTMQYASWG